MVGLGDGGERRGGGGRRFLGGGGDLRPAERGGGERCVDAPGEDELVCLQFTLLGQSHFPSASLNSVPEGQLL